MRLGAALLTSMLLLRTAPAAADEAIRAPRLLDIPTAWLPANGAFFASGGANHHVDALFAFALGLLGVAEVELKLTETFAGCTCRVAGERPVVVHTPMVLFKVGLPERTFGAWQPAVALGFERTLLAREHRIGTFAAPSTAAHLYLATSLSFRWLSLHGGASLWDAASSDDANGTRLALSDHLRPFGGLEWTPPWYPRTTLLGEISWVPSFEPSAIELRWIASWAVRYRVAPWAQVELGMRFRQTAGLGDTQVLVRANVTGKIW